MTVQSKYPALRYAVIFPAGLADPSRSLSSARSLAQSMIERVGGYGFTLGEAGSLDASRVPGPISIVRTADSVSIELTSDNVSIADNPVEAGNLAGFTTLVPSYLPPGYTALNNWYVSWGNGTVVTTGSTIQPKTSSLSTSESRPGELEVQNSRNRPATVQFK
jgi:hypothetical protein